MNKEEMILRGIDEIPMFTFNTKTKEFSVLGHKFEGVNSIEDFCNYIHGLDEENKQLQEKEELHLNRIDELTDRVVKLETNRDEAIEILKLCNSQCSKETISILERGKE